MKTICCAPTQEALKTAPISILAKYPVLFFREVVMPDAPTEDVIMAAKGILLGKRVCVWPGNVLPGEELIPTVYSLHPPKISKEDQDEYHQPAGEYEDLVIIDLLP